mmetsp:Transcript_84168/g.234670  ORF Transcript_84168/g.234670 Transcript_84168/m.234670 type:complete len:267 (+) Transcript_84168:75-875(+)
MPCNHLHAEDAEVLGLVVWHAAADAKTACEHLPRVLRSDDPVVPEAGGRVIHRALPLVLFQRRRVERGQGGVVHEGLALALELLLLYRGEDASGLRAAHDADFRVRPREHEAGVVRPAAHGVGSSPMASTDYNRDLRHGRASHGVDHLGTVFGNAAVLVSLSDHEACDVLQEQQGHLALAAQLDEVRTLLRRLAEEDAVVGDDADRIAVDVRKATNQGRRVSCLELTKSRAVGDPRDDLPDLERLRILLWYDAGKLGRVVERELWA